MAIRSGIGGQIGYVAESTYGTYLAPTKFREMTSTLKDTSTYAYPTGVAGGRMQPLGSRSLRTAVVAGGDLVGPVMTTGMGFLLQNLMGTSVTPVIIGAGPGYTQTHTLADPFGKSLTVQIGLPEMSTGTVQDYSFLGCKTLGADFTCSVGEVLTATWHLAAREMTEAQTLAAASYPTTGATFPWTQAEIKVGATVGAAAHVDGMRGVSVSINRPQSLERNYAGNLGKMSEPIINEYDENIITGTLDADYVTKADLYDRYHAHTAFALVWEFVGAAFTGGFETFRITLPQCYFTGETPDLSGPDLVTGSLPFVTTFDGSTQPFITYLSQEAAL